MSKLKIAIIFGGTNTEHEVSLVSAKGVIAALDKNKYDIIPIKITKENIWITPKEVSASYTPILSNGIVDAEKAINSIDNILDVHSIDIVFPLLHGPYGEDGTIQGLLELMHIPYVGCGVTGSAVCMDKIIQKNVCLAYNIPVVPFFWFSASDWLQNHDTTLTNLLAKLPKYPLFVKPANQGSSVGITKAHNQKELEEGIELAISRDTKIIIEQAVPNVREIECGVIGITSQPEISDLGEIIPDQEFYSYESKYLSGNSQAIIPAKINKELVESIKQTAKLAFQATDCYGLSRLDFLLNNETGEYYLNEINTMPGFTPISMFPKLWEASGVTYSQLLDKLISLALERSQIKSRLNFSK